MSLPEGRTQPERKEGERAEEAGERGWAWLQRTCLGVQQQESRRQCLPPAEEGELIHHITRDSRTNKAKAHTKPQKDSKEARLHYKMIASSKNYRLLEIDLQTGRHHQIRCQLAKIGTPIRGDLKYGAPRSNKGGGISLHSRSLEFTHPVTKEHLKVTAPVPQDDNLWMFFEDAVK